MSYQITIEEHPAYLFASGTGERNEANVRRFLVEAYQLAVSRAKTQFILLEVKFEGPNLNVAEAYAVVSDRIADATKFKRIAYVDANYALAPDGVEFAELAAKNLGVNVRLLKTVEDAKCWLDTPD